MTQPCLQPHWRHWPLMLRQLRLTQCYQLQYQLRRHSLRHPHLLNQRHWHLAQQQHCRLKLLPYSRRPSMKLLDQLAIVQLRRRLTQLRQPWQHFGQQHQRQLLLH